MRSRSVSRVIPALLTNTSTRPQVSIADLTKLSTCASWDTSAWIAIASPPLLLISVTTSSAAMTELAKFTITFAPSPASATAIARPIPLDAPVTIAT